MAANKCSQCGNETFEITELATANGGIPRRIVACVACGATAGVLEDAEQTAQLRAQSERIAALHIEVRGMRSAFEQIAQQLGRI